MSVQRVGFGANGVSSHPCLSWSRQFPTEPFSLQTVSKSLVLAAATIRSRKRRASASVTGFSAPPNVHHQAPIPTAGGDDQAQEQAGFHGLA